VGSARLAHKASPDPGIRIPRAGDAAETSACALRAAGCVTFIRFNRDETIRARTRDDNLLIRVGSRAGILYERAFSPLLRRKTIASNRDDKRERASLKTKKRARLSRYRSTFVDRTELANGREPGSIKRIISSDVNDAFHKVTGVFAITYNFTRAWPRAQRLPLVCYICSGRFHRGRRAARCPSRLEMNPPLRLPRDLPRRGSSLGFPRLFPQRFFRVILRNVGSRSTEVAQNDRGGCEKNSKTDSRNIARARATMIYGYISVSRKCPQPSADLTLPLSLSLSSSRREISERRSDFSARYLVG